MNLTNDKHEINALREQLEGLLSAVVIRTSADPALERASETLHSCRMSLLDTIDILATSGDQLLRNEETLLRAIEGFRQRVDSHNLAVGSM